MECSICIEAIQGETNVAKTECGHVFHFQCLIRWSQDHNSCPMCRQEFVKKEPEPEQQRETEYIENSHGLVGIPAQVVDEDAFIERQEEFYEIPERAFREPRRRLAKEFLRLTRMGNLTPRHKKQRLLQDLGIPLCAFEAGYRSS
jgi:hypothetical protein